MSPVSRDPRQTAWALFALIGSIAVLHFAEDVLVPVALALLLSFLLTPIAERLEQWGLRRPLAVAVTTVVAFTVAGVVVYVVASQFLGLVQDLPVYRDNLMKKIQSVQGSTGGGLERSVETVQELTDELKKAAPGKAESPEIARVQIVDPPPNVAQVVRGLFGPLIAPISTAAIVVVFVIFILLQREDLRDRLVRLLGARAMHTTVLALEDAAARVSRYLLAQTLINAVQGSLVALGLYLIGVPEPLLWGALTVVLRFIPYLGPVLAAVGPIALSIAYFDGWSSPLMVVGLIVALELVSNNLLEPRFYGASVGVSSFALIVAAVFWTWLWGTAGLFLATPLTVCLVVMGKYIPQLEFLGVLLTDKPALAPSERFYQRLLADDADEAQALIEEALAEGSLAKVSDELVLPALRYAEQDHDRGAIDAGRRDAIVDRIDAAIDDLVEPEPAADAPPPQGTRAPTVLCLPSADRADEVAARLVARLLRDAGFDGRAVAVATLKGEMLELATALDVEVICVSAAPPAAIAHARYLCKRLRGRLPSVPIVVGLWDAQGDLTRAQERLAVVGASKVVANAAAALDEIGHLLQPALQGVVAEVGSDPTCSASADKGRV